MELFLGTNPFVLRNAISSKHETIAGFVWLVAGLVVSLVGIVRSARGHVGYLVGAWFDIAVLLATALVLWRLTTVVTDRTARAEYVSAIVANQREVYARDVFVIFHDGRHRTDPLDARLDDSVKRDRWQDAAETFDRLSKLLDEPRHPGEDYQAYAARISAYFPGVDRD